MDLQSLGLPPSIEGLQALSSERQANALRYWLRKIHSDTPSQAQLMALLSQIAACQTRGHSIDLRVGQGMVVRQGQHLHYVSPL
jgi:tRNA(Ile)-lysidine synthase